jgi:hypothetical protein
LEYCKAGLLAIFTILTSKEKNMTLPAILQAELALFMKPLDAFLTALQQPGVNTQAAVQDYVQLQVASIGTLPAAETTAINTTAATAQTQLHAALASATTPVTGSAEPVPNAL